jgi:peptide/nickel transport system permease protein
LSIAFRSNAIKRVFHGLLMYLVMAFAYSLVFNGIAEKNLRAQVDEDVVQLLRGMENLNAEDFQRLQADTRLVKIRQYHLDEPWGFRVIWRTLDILSFHFGRSTGLKSANGDRGVAAIVFEALPNTLFLFATESVLVLALGGLIGFRAARKPGSRLDRLASVLPMALNGLPAWWVGMLALMLFSYAIPLFPSGGVHANPAPGGWAGIADYLWHMILPLLTVVGLNLWNAAWLIRNLLADAYSKDFVAFARARGLSEMKVGMHVLAVLRPAIATMALLGLVQSISGNILVEGIFNWPGLGSLYFAAAQQSDVPVLMAILSLQTALNLSALVLLDLSYGWMDPRIRVGGGK